MSEAIRVALIDDDYAIRDSIADILESQGYAVTLYANGKEALEGLAKAAPPRMILCDLVMPVMNGWQFLDEQERQPGETSKIPVVVLSATPDYSLLEHASVQEVAPKPIDIDSLMDLVEKHTARPEEERKEKWKQ